MTDGQYRLRVKHGAGEFEIEGSENFVERHWKNLQPLIADASTPSHPSGKASSNVSAPQVSSAKEAFPDSFGEYRNSFGKLTKTDEVLIACNFVVRGSSASVFNNKEVGDLLKEHGVKVSVSGSISNLLRSDRVFRDGTKGIRVSKEGFEHIAELQSKA